MNNEIKQKLLYSYKFKFENTIEVIKQLNKHKIDQRNNMRLYSEEMVFYLLYVWHVKKSKWMTKTRKHLGLSHRLTFALCILFKKYFSLDFYSECEYSDREFYKFATIWWFLTIDNYEDELIVNSLPSNFWKNFRNQKTSLFYDKYIKFKQPTNILSLWYEKINNIANNTDSDNLVLFNKPTCNDNSLEKRYLLVKEILIKEFSVDKKVIKAQSVIIKKIFFNAVSFNKESKFYTPEIEKMHDLVVSYFYNLFTSKKIEYLKQELWHEFPELDELIVFNFEGLKKFDLCLNLINYEDIIRKSIKKFVLQKLIKNIQSKQACFIVFLDSFNDTYNNITEAFLSNFCDIQKIWFSTSNLTLVNGKSMKINDIIIFPDVIRKYIIELYGNKNNFIFADYKLIRIRSSYYIEKVLLEIVRAIYFNLDFIKKTD